MSRHRRTAVKSEKVEEVEVQEDFQDDDGPEPVTTVLVRGRSSHGPTMPDNKRYGHWSGGDSIHMSGVPGGGQVTPEALAIHWPGDQMKEIRVTIAQLDRLKLDPHLSLVYDPTEEAIARTNVAPDQKAKQLAKAALATELHAQELRAQAAVAAANAVALDEQKKLIDMRKKASQLGVAQ